MCENMPTYMMPPRQEPDLEVYQDGFGWMPLSFVIGVEALADAGLDVMEARE